jgi:general secretion pathway protein F
VSSQYLVTASNSSGRTVKLVIESDSQKGARLAAKAKGLTPISVETADAATLKKSEGLAGQLTSSLSGIKSAELANMTRQLAVLLKAHVPVVESLSALVEQIENPKLKTMLGTIRQSVKEGRGLADGFAQFPKIFNKVYINMVKAGESSGRLDVVLLRLADFGEAQEKLKSKVIGALTYPIIMIVVGFVAMGVILIKVIPTVTQIFIDMDQVLPTPTRILIAISEFAQNYFFHILIGGLVIGILIERYIATPHGRLKKDQILLGVKVLGQLMRGLAVARFARTLGTLLASGVPMLTALTITRNVVSNAVFEEVIDEAGKAVGEGRSLAFSLKQSRQFPPIVIHMVGVGEKTGELEGMLANVADNYENQVDQTLNNLTSILQPVIMLVMAVVVGFIVMSVLLPILEMNSMAG